MSALPWTYNTVHSVDQNTFSASSKETNTISHQAKQCKRRNKKNKKKNSTTEFQQLSCDQKRGVKRKSDELLGVKPKCVKHKNISDFLSEQSSNVHFKRPRISPPTPSTLRLTDSWEVDSGFSSETSPPTSGRSSPCMEMDCSRLVALDCEMVGTGPGGQCSEVARCSIVNYYGTVVYDKYILPRHPVTDYRTRWSGIRKHHLTGAVPFEDAQNEIVDILKGKIIVGHALFHDFQVLNISVPALLIRDTCSCVLLRELYNAACQSNVSLKKLSQKLLNRTIQSGRMGHCSIEDARAALDLYKLVEDQWEKDFLSPDSTDGQTSKPNSSLEHYMQDQYWPDSMMDCSL